jgi:hypothetical protein
MKNDRDTASDPGEFTVLDLDDRRTSPVFVWAGSVEESLRTVPTDVVKEYAVWTRLSAEFRAAAKAELARRGISPPEA